MKKIDLLNKIANDELDDKTRVIFKEHNTECIYHKKEKRFEFIKKGDWNDYFYTFDLAELNDEVEILEEKPKKIDDFELRNEKGETLIGANMWTIYYKLNELIKAVNYLLEKSDKDD